MYDHELVFDTIQYLDLQANPKIIVIHLHMS